MPISRRANVRTTKQQFILTASFLMAVVLPLAACAEPPTEPVQETDVLMAKPSCPGHPSCKPDDPPDDPPGALSPVIAFAEGGALWVSNADGSGETFVPTGNAASVWHHSWAPGGDGEIEPYKLVFESDFVLYTVEVWTTSGTLSFGQAQPINLPTEARAPDWGSSGEILYLARAPSPPSDQLHWAIYVISDTELPNPTPTQVYVASVGITEANYHSVYEATWNPAGDAIAFVEEDEVQPYTWEHALRVVDRATGIVSTVFDYGSFSGAGWGMDWSATESANALAYAFEIPAKRGITLEIRSLRLSSDGAGSYSAAGELFSPITGFAFPTWSADDTQLLVSDLKTLKTLDVASGGVDATLTRRDGRSSDWRR